jgi:predicted CXXCH cytochrome family protein
VAIVSSLLFLPHQAVSIENQECMECHSDTTLARQKSEGMRQELSLDYEKFKYSVHNVNGIGCTDCHSAIDRLDYDAEMPHSTSVAAPRCYDCHDVEGKEYRNSVHFKASGKGVTIPCYACHGYHYVTRLESNNVLERENNFCLKCHDPRKFHDWLPQKETHFAHVECTVCHAPDAPRQIHLTFFNLMTNEYLSTRDMLKALNANHVDFMELFDHDKNDIIDVHELEDIVLLLRQKGIRGTFHGELLSDVQAVVHHVNRGEAKSECETCHMPTSPFFESVAIALKHEDGTVKSYMMERNVLETYYVNHFYALGGTRVRVLDKVGIAMLLAGFGVVCLHLGGRVAASLAGKGKRGRQKTKKTSL